MVYYCNNSCFKHVCLFVNTFDKMNRPAQPLFFIFMLTLILIGIVTALGKESYRKYQLDKEIGDVKKEVEFFKKKNNILSNLLDYFNSEKFLEKEIRLKLNLMKEGERLVVISPQKKIEAESQISGSVQKKQISNFEKWINYLFED